MADEVIGKPSKLHGIATIRVRYHESRASALYLFLADLSHRSFMLGHALLSAHGG